MEKGERSGKFCSEFRAASRGEGRLSAKTFSRDFEEINISLAKVGLLKDRREIGAVRLVLVLIPLAY